MSIQEENKHTQAEFNVSKRLASIIAHLKKYATN
jgi:hypothetical protein